ncbi:endonuclease III [Candidatus Woesearchaeota archaeon]|nr:endonuclease III [Candidatus Woesearchaeota archaeon]
MGDYKNIEKIIEILKKIYPFCFFPTNAEKDPYYVLISCLLSLRTKDEVTYPAAKRLFKLAKTPEEMIKLSDEQIKKAIYPVGFYNNKTRTVKEISQLLIEKYNSKVPDSIDELLKLKGVGRKTANIVVTQGFNKLGIAVDTHVHRISNRMGLVKSKTPHETEFALREIIPKKYWIILNELLVKHGQNVCKPRKPLCFKCKIEKYCNYKEKNIK